MKNSSAPNPDSELVAELDPVSVFILPPRIIQVDLQGGVTEYTDTFEASGRPDGAYQFAWRFGDGTIRTDTPGAGKNSSVSHSYTGLQDGDKIYLTVKLRDQSGAFLAEDSIVIHVSTESSAVEAALQDYDCGWDVDYSGLTYIRTEHPGGQILDRFITEDDKTHGVSIQYNSARDSILQRCRYRGRQHGISRQWAEGEMVAESARISEEGPTLAGSVKKAAEERLIRNQHYGIYGAPECRIIIRNQGYTDVERIDGYCQWQWFAPSPSHPGSD